MRDKIILIKDILKIAISIFIIVTCVKSCSHAATPSKVKNMINTCMTVSGFTEQKREEEIATINETWLENYNNDNIGIICYLSGTTTSGTWYIRFVNLSQTNSQHPYRYSQNTTLWAIQGYYKVAQISFSAGSTISGSRYSYNTTTDSAANSNVAKTNGYIYTDFNIYSASSGGTIVYAAETGSPSTFTPNGPYADSKEWGYVNSEYGDIEISNFTINGEDKIYLTKYNNEYSGATGWNGIQIGGADQIHSIQSITAYRYNKNYGFWQSYSLLDFVMHGVIDSTSNTTYIYSTQPQTMQDSIIKIRLFRENDPEFEHSYTIWIYTWSPKTIINNGTVDVIGTINNYDYSGDNSYSNENNQVAQEQQNKENQSWIEEKVKEWFTIESGDIIELVDNTIASLELGSGEIAVDLEILNYIRDGEAEDFVISWNSYNPNLTIKGVPIRSGDGNILGAMGYMIPGNSINFSKMERNNETFHAVMEWERIIINISLIMILANQYYLTILTLFGVSTFEFGHNKDEKEKVKTPIKEPASEEPKVDPTKYEQRYLNWLRGGK